MSGPDQPGAPTGDLPESDAPTGLTRVDPRHDLRHRPAPGGRMRDSLFWQTVLPDAGLALQVYLFVTGTGAAGYNIAVWGRDGVVALERDGGRVPEAMDFDDFEVSALRIRNDGALRTSTVTVRGSSLSLDLSFEALHDAFTFRDNPDGLPAWFADDRIEQTGRVTGTLTVGDRAQELGPLGHRDHSWGLRDWRAPQHWKWFVAYTADGARAVNGWIWQARGEWGFAGYVFRDGALVPVARIEQRTTYTDAMEQQRLVATLHDVVGGRTALELDAFGILPLPDERSGTMILEGAATGTIDGVAAVGQFETEWPADYFAHLAAGAAS
ncbi:DUF7064 domain-containing protein [Frondihabitans australicus]|uniref:DUF7064 domain-containing protein n=1 Tax=Frondihabitans australicus TaxID=386892 RepID=A0A495IGB3_9MICO|nr:hypothetical protein [Frondihabitans australicus]RKR74371.1 hypothetical protein C8E83_1482 [Frondihabitans australicus]